MKFMKQRGEEKMKEIGKKSKKKGNGKKRYKALNLLP